MATPKPSIPKGMRDFNPEQLSKRNYIFDTIKRVFRLYGYQNIETPTMENLSTLMGKYGDEGDKLLFKVLDSGDFTKGVDMSNTNTAKLATELCGKGLRYDLTVPFARYVVQHQSEIVFPFKRFQIQPVWRADRPQKGRYREFYQCDVDVIGSTSLLHEAELIAIVAEVFKELSVGVTLKINNRKVLFGIAESIGFADKMVDITVAIDKLDKIGLDSVNEELAQKGLSEDAIKALKPILELSGTNNEKIEKLRSILSVSEVGQKGLDEMAQIFSYVESLGVKGLEIDFDLSLARGLSYYTGAIFEVKANDFAIGSISGGGRYDDLTGIFGLNGTSGVGISFGADRIYDVLEGLNLFPTQAGSTTQVIFANFGENEMCASLALVQELRNSGISTEVYPTNQKIKKQFDYAEAKGATYLVFIGETELTNKVATVKNIVTGEQQNVPFNELNNFFSSILK